MSKSKNSSNLEDSEFGLIKITRSYASRRLSIRLDASGNLKITTPYLVRDKQIMSFLEDNRSAIRKSLVNRPNKTVYKEGHVIGKNHLLKIEIGEPGNVTVRPNYLVVRLPDASLITDDNIQSLIRQKISKVLRQQAKNYLPERLTYLAKKHDFVCSNIRLSHATTRWGSCSSRSTISLNISLMTLPNELIDYVIIHELCHTRHMNHSRAFWQEVSKIMPDYKLKEKSLKRYSAII